MMDNSYLKTAAFDARPEAIPLFKERVLWTVLIGGFFFLVYGSTNQISALTAPHPFFYFDWEVFLPFIPELIIPYMSSDVIFVLVFLLARTREDLQRLGMRCALAIVISAVFFLAFPLEFSFERPETTGWTKPFFDILSLDQTYNQFPSLHISLGYLCWRALHERTILLLRPLLLIWFGMIAASTLLVYQHHAIDLVGGVLVVMAVHFLIPHRGKGWIKLPFVSPRHLHLALRFLIGAILFTIMAFNVPVFWPLFTWIAISLLLVSACYTLGKNNFLTKSRSGFSLVTWGLFAPYLIGCKLNWYFWRPKVSSYSVLKDDLLVGAKPRPTDVMQLKAENIRTIIDLAPELSPSRATDMDYQHYPLLDIAIPDPARLLNIAEQIEAARDKGAVYVHCALGMSRSILASAAWLMIQGHSKENALAMIDSVRPERSHRPYMMIALDLFENFLKQHRRTLMEDANE